MTRLRTLGPRIRQVDIRTVRLPDKVKAAIYNTPAFRAWRTEVVQHADGRCQAVDHHGRRCIKAEPDHRMYADHIVELSDGGSPFDPSNGQCLCASHHELKTIDQRRKRYHQ